MMKFNVNSDEMGKSIQTLAKMVNGKSSLAILDHFRFEVDGDRLHVSASDGENIIKTSLNINLLSMLDDEDNKVFCIHNTVICDFLKNIPSQPIVFVVDMKNYVVTIQYMNGHIKFPCVSGKDYPVINFLKGEYNTVVISSEIILEDINRTIPFMGQETLRPTMNTICFNFDSDGLDVVSTNGGVMVKIYHPNITTEKTLRFLLPQKPASMLKFFLNKEDDDVTVKFSENGAVFENNNWQMSCLLVEGKYPNYNSVIPQSCNIEVQVEKKLLQECIKRMLPMGNQTSKSIKVDINNDQMTVSTEDIDFNTSAKESVNCKTSGNNFTIGMNGDTLNTILSHIHSDTVKMAMTEINRPIIIEPDEDKENEIFMGLVMPTLLY